MYKELTNGLDFKEKTMIYGYRMMSENARIPGLLVDKDGKQIPMHMLYPVKYFDLAVNRGIIEKIHDNLYMFSRWYSYFRFFPAIEDFEIFRKNNGLKKKDMIPILDKYFWGCIDDRCGTIVDYYTACLQAKKTKVSLIDVIIQRVNPEHHVLVKSYMLLFSSRRQYDRGEYSSSVKAHEGLIELVDMINSHCFYFNGNEYNVDSDVVLECIGYVSTLNRLVGLSNNNYLKKVMIGRITGEKTGVNKKNGEGY